MTKSEAVRMAKLLPDEIKEALGDVPGWSLVGDAISKTFTFKSFPDAIAFVNRVALVAEEVDHHPDIQVNYKRVTLTYSTHSEGGLTSKDFEGAKAADAVAMP